MGERGREDFLAQEVKEMVKTANLGILYSFSIMVQGRGRGRVP